MKTRIAALSLLLLAACGEQKEVAEVVRQTLSEARADYIVTIQVRLDHAEMPTDDELQVRKQIEERIERENAGRVIVASADAGHYDITVQVDNTAEAVPRIRTILREAGVLDRAAVTVAEKKR